MPQATAKNNVDPAFQPQPLKVSRVFHARRETVFKAWSSADHVKRWFAPAPCSVPEARVEMRVGGPFEICMLLPSGEKHWVRGTFVEVTPVSRLVIDMRVTDEAGAPLFTAFTEVDFADAVGGTRMDVVQSYKVSNPAVAARMMAGAEAGWRGALDQLEREVTRIVEEARTEASGGGRSVVHAVFHLERTYDAPVARVWKALTDEKAKAKWFAASDRLQLLERHMDVRVGGTERAKGRWEGGMVSTFDAIYHDVVPNERLVYSYVMHLDDRKISVSLATMQLTADGGKTTLKVSEQGAFLDGYDDSGSREHGTGFLLDALGASLAE
jgi:uncharacterized protein YndB with AHSA1/START domain